MEDEECLARAVAAANSLVLQSEAELRRSVDDFEASVGGGDCATASLGQPSDGSVRLRERESTLYKFDEVLDTALGGNERGLGVVSVV